MKGGQKPSSKPSSKREEGLIIACSMKKKIIGNISKVEKKINIKPSPKDPQSGYCEEISMETHYNQILRSQRRRSLTAIEKANLSCTGEQTQEYLQIYQQKS